MTRLSSFFLPTLKEAPADAEAISHKLMVRAGLIRQLGAGIWTYLPAGWRVNRKIGRIIGGERDAMGGQEMLMPVLQPAEPWRTTGRYGIEELFKLKDRRDADLVLAMTHEENLTFHIAREVRSYRELPKILYHIQTKERDEPRPRAGVLRAREFTMKDSYSFDRDVAGLERSYELHIQAYDRIFDRCGLRWYRVEADVGMMGGVGAHDYMAPCPAGENEIALAPGYAADVEVASANPRPVALPPVLDQPHEVPTPGLTTVEEVSAALGVPAAAALKAIPVVVEGRGFVLTLLRGDHRLNELKLRNALGAEFRPAHREEIEAKLGPPGFIGPVGADVPVIKDAAIRGEGYFGGAHTPGVHLYGIGPARIMAAAIEQRADERGIVWPRSIAPWQIHLVALGRAGDDTTAAAEQIYEQLRASGEGVLYDDREAGTGEKLTDAELLGCPLRLTVGPRALAEGVIEAQLRESGSEERLGAANGPAAALDLLERTR